MVNKWRQGHQAAMTITLLQGTRRHGQQMEAKIPGCNDDNTYFYKGEGAMVNKLRQGHQAAMMIAFLQGTRRRGQTRAVTAD